ncbi:MAG: hypothetical protein Tsb0015_15160 [Simkaniaceae bacterium]
MKKIWADAGYTGEEMEQKVRSSAKIQLEITKKSKQRFVVILRRWVVERSIAWINRYCRLSEDYEYRTTTSKALIYMTETRLILRGIAAI